MAQPQLTLRLYSGSKEENFRENEEVLRSILAVTAIPADQPAIFLLSYLRDAALGFFQTWPSAAPNKADAADAAFKQTRCGQDTALNPERKIAFCSRSTFSLNSARFHQNYL